MTLHIDYAIDIIITHIFAGQPQPAYSAIITFAIDSAIAIGAVPLLSLN
jgi:hypothetical protein